MTPAYHYVKIQFVDLVVGVEIELLDCIDVVLSLVIIILDLGALLICISTCREFASVLRGFTTTESVTQSETTARPTSPTQQNQHSESPIANISSTKPQESSSARVVVYDFNLPSSSTETKDNTGSQLDTPIKKYLTDNMFQEDLDCFKYQRAFQIYQSKDRLDSDISTESQEVSEQNSEYQTRHLHSLKDVQVLRDQIALREYLSRHSSSVRQPHQVSAFNCIAHNLSSADDDDLCDVRDLKPIQESAIYTGRMVEDIIREDDEITRLTRELSLEIMESVAMDVKFLEQSAKNVHESEQQTDPNPKLLLDIERDYLSPKPDDKSPLTFDDLRTPTPIDWNEVPQGEASPSAIPSWAVLPEWALDKTE
ncbi:hypothetical protein LOTGIDRAFT_232882 [Lottia gigantea]|uniref:Uncharacterized protein n=1 Tax=Lottia gigantea TaxID=225164 RepID=V3ZMY3_LOTGI|nr:hypothetical protein LOTGIDRAFT_232882 [Lottia gigantea]ESO92738.1 hypothetical protein LOTGIDRAFT_232882 [Lottia gigantea]